MEETRPEVNEIPLLSLSLISQLNLSLREEHLGPQFHFCYGVHAFAMLPAPCVEDICPGLCLQLLIIRVNPRVLHCLSTHVLERGSLSIPAWVCLIFRLAKKSFIVALKKRNK